MAIFTITNNKVGAKDFRTSNQEITIDTTLIKISQLQI